MYAIQEQREMETGGSLIFAACQPNRKKEKQKEEKKMMQAEV